MILCVGNEEEEQNKEEIPIVIASCSKDQAKVEQIFSVVLPSGGSSSFFPYPPLVPSHRHIVDCKIRH